MIDLSQPPYNVRGDWNGSDTTATNNTNALKQAIFDAKASNTVSGIVDNGGTQGDTIILPKGSIMFDDTLELGDGVSFQGSGDYATNLILKSTFDPNKKAIILGSSGDTFSSFGGRLCNMCVWGRKDLAAATTAALVYSNDVQDGTLLDHVRLYGFNRRPFWGEIGYGGASIIRIRQVTGNYSVPGIPAFTFDYGEGTMIDIDGIEPSGARVDPTSESSPAIAGTIGILAKGGFFSFRRVHGELLDTTLQINLKSAKCFCDVNFMIGGPMNRNAIVVNNNAAQLNRIRLANITRGGETDHLVLNGQSSASHINSDILDPIRL